MKINLKRIGLWLFVPLLLLLGLATVMGLVGKNDIDSPRNFQPAPLPIPTDSASIALGQKWATSLCTGCHGENYAGTKFMDVPELGYVAAPNLTPAGPVAQYSDADWVKAIRHGLRKNGQPFVIMPSENFQYMGDEHLAQLIAYLKSLPPVEQAWPARHFPFPSYIAYQLGLMGMLPTDKIDHDVKPKAPNKAETVEYGLYLAKMYGCQQCHGEDLRGGTSPDAESPPCPDISANSIVGNWGTEAFTKTIRTGLTPMGKELNARFMPWREHGRLDDVQLRAIYAFLVSK